MRRVISLMTDSVNVSVRALTRNCCKGLSIWSGYELKYTTSSGRWATGSKELTLAEYNVGMLSMVEARGLEVSW